MDTTLRFDRGTLVLEGFSQLPADIANYFRYDARIDAFRASSHRYNAILQHLRGMLAANRVPRYDRLRLQPALSFDTYRHQQEALEAWKGANGRGLVVLPTGAGKSLIGILAIAWAGRSSLVVVPTIDLMHQWYALLRAAFPDFEIGLIGGGYYEVRGLSVATYDSAAIYMDRLGNRFGTVVFDEVHHLPSDFYRTIAEFSIAPFRLGLSATPERSDQRHIDLIDLVGPVVYRKEAGELAGDVLAPFKINRIYVDLSEGEREAYEQALALRNNFLRDHNIALSSLHGWRNFVMLSARSQEGRRAMRAHREARRLAHAAPAKLRALESLLAEFVHEKIIIFTEDNSSAYEISQRFLIPCITHQTRVKERHDTLWSFKQGEYRAVVTSRVLNEGVDVPDASVGIILSGSATNREFVQRLGRILRRGENKRAVLFEVIAKQTKEELASFRRRRPLPFESPQLSLFALLDREED